MKKVVHLSSVNKINDIRLFVKECRSLVRSGYAVTLVTPHDRNEIVDGVQIKAVPMPSSRLERMTATAVWIYREAVRLNADLYHFHMVELIPVGLLLRARGKKVIYDIYEDMPRAILLRYYLPNYTKRLISWLLERLENFAARRFSALIAATPTIGERFQAFNTQAIVANNYPLRDEFRPPDHISWTKRSPSVAYVGEIVPDHGLYQMVEAMACLPSHLNSTLKLAGSFSPPESYAHATHLPGWDRVEQLGVLNRSQVAQLLSQVSAGLVNYLPVPNKPKSMPNKLFEYMSAGIPVVASNFPLWRRIIEDAGCGLLVDPKDPRAIAEAVEYLLTHPEEAEKMGKRGRKAVEERYNWLIEEKKLLRLYKDLLE